MKFDSSKFSKQNFFVLDPFSLKSIASKPRLEIHADGDWHFALTAFIVRKNSSGQLEVLVQERSDYVDIAQKHFDQSLATQLLTGDKGDFDTALMRGLKQELNIKRDDVRTYSLWNRAGSMYINKNYGENPELWNREVMLNYIVILNDSADIRGNFKVANYEWLPWEEFCNLVTVQPNRFTKSVRAYCAADSLSELVYKSILKLEKGESIEKFAGKIYYLSEVDTDLVLLMREDGGKIWELEVYKTNYSMRKVTSKKLSDISSFMDYYFSDVRDLDLGGLLANYSIKV